MAKYNGNYCFEIKGINFKLIHSTQRENEERIPVLYL